MSSQPKYGTKRKRIKEGHSKAHVKSIKRPTIDPVTKFKTKLHHSIKEVKKASKVAKTREVQRLVKRLKELRSKQGEENAISQAEEQLEILKEIDHELLASNMLLRRLIKDKHISSNEEVKAVLDAESPSLGYSKSSIESNSTRTLVENRMTSSKVLASQVTMEMNALREVLFPSKEVETSKEKNVIEELAEAADDGWESGSVDDVRPPPRRTPSDEDMAPSESDDEEEDEEDKDESEDESLPDEPAKKRHKGSGPATHVEDAEDEFLPSLAVGYTRGDSDASDWSGDDDVAEQAVAPRKNRRGQRARQAIWEKKYGRNAKHVKKAQEEGRVVANSKGGPRRGKPFGHREQGGFRKKEEKKLVPAGSNAVPLGTKGKSDGPLHPSWEAAKKRKSQPLIVAPMGKKIVFS